MDFFDTIHAYFRENPKVMALVPTTLAAVVLLGAWFNWDWLYAPSGSLRGLGGISAFLGRTAARITGVVIAALLLLSAYLMYSVDKW